MKNLKITAPEGYEIDKENSTFEYIVFKPIKKELPKSWEELTIKGYYVSSASSISPLNEPKRNYSGRLNTFATKEQAEASLSLAQLSQLREVYRDGWKPDWSDDNERKFTIEILNNKIYNDWTKNYGCFLSFQSAEVRDLFLENFRDLIEQAKPLMS